MTVPQQLTGPEKVLYKAEYQFALKELQLSEDQAKEMAEQKIIKKRALGKTIKFRY
jgi:hypothetical protein